MSGDNQHFIPKQYLKGFKIRGLSGGKQAWVYRSDAPPKMDYIDDIAADEHFYSPPAPGSLDDVITKYENRLAAHLKALRKAPLGPLPDPHVPAEIISHLTVRTDSFRTAIASAMQQMALSMFQTFRTEDAIHRLMELEGDGPGKALKKLVDELTEKYAAEMQAKGLSKEAVERLALGLAKEKLPEMVAQFQPLLAATTARIHGSAGEMVANAQKKALGESLAPEERVAFLATLSWEIIPAIEPAILPDCVSIALCNDDRPKPLIISDQDDIRAVIFPLDAKRLLIGRRATDSDVRPPLFNIYAASCAEQFFVSSVQDAKLEEWAKFVGVVSKATIQEKLSNIFAEYRSKDQAPAVLAGTSASFPLCFPPGSDPAICKNIHEKILAIVSWVMSQLSLDRVDAIAFADNVPEKIAEVYQAAGRPGVPALPGTYAATVLILKDETVRTQLVFHSSIAMALLDETKPEWLPASYIIAKQLADANAHIAFDTAFPGTLLRPHTSLFNALRYEQVAQAWSGYLAARFAGQIWVGETEDRRTAMLAALEALKAALPGIGARFAASRNHDLVLREVMPYVQAFLMNTAVLAGLLEAAELNILNDASVTEAVRSVGLTDWLRSFVRDLHIVWDQRGRWSSLEEFIGLGRHTERILWACGIVLSQTSDGQCRVEFPAIGQLPSAP